MSPGRRRPRGCHVRERRRVLAALRGWVLRRGGVGSALERAGRKSLSMMVATMERGEGIGKDREGAEARGDEGGGGSGVRAEVRAVAAGDVDGGRLPNPTLTTPTAISPSP